MDGFYLKVLTSAFPTASFMLVNQALVLLSQLSSSIPNAFSQHVSPETLATFEPHHDELDSMNNDLKKKRLQNAQVSVHRARVENINLAERIKTLKEENRKLQV